MKKIISFIVAMLCFSLTLAACSNSNGDIHNGEYTFYNITFGSSSIDKTDTLETVKEKLIIEFPKLESEWNTWHDRLQVDIMAEGFLERTTTTDFFDITGNKMSFDVYNMIYGFDVDQQSQKYNEKYRLNSEKIETRRFFMHNEFGYRWIGSELRYENETIYYEWWGAKVNFKTPVEAI